MGKQVNCVVCDTHWTQEDKQSESFKEDDCVGSNVQVYFFLRHVIKLPISQIEKYLVWCSPGGKWHGKGTENMSNWIWLCRDCKIFVLKLEQIYKETERLRKESVRLEEVIRLKILNSLETSMLVSNFDNEPDSENEQLAIFNVTREVRELVKMKQVGLDLNTIKTEGRDNNDTDTDWLMRSENDDDELLHVELQKEDFNHCDDDDGDEYTIPCSKRSKIKTRIKRKTASRLPTTSSSSSVSSDGSGEEDEGLQETTPLKMYTCSIETCGKSQEKMDVDTFLEHLVYHKKLNSQCTKCSKVFAPGITKNAHWRTSHFDFWRSTPKTQYFREISPILPEIPWFCPLPECTNQKLQFSTKDKLDKHYSENHIGLTSRPSIIFTKLCTVCCTSDFYSKDEYKIHQFCVHEIDPKRKKTKLNSLSPRLRPLSNSNSVGCADIKNYGFSSEDRKIMNSGAQGLEEQHDMTKRSHNSPENPWKCDIETCPKSKTETMTVEQFLEHWGIHKRKKWKCTKCGLHFSPGISRKSHWSLRHFKIMKSVPEENWFEEICPILPTIKWPCPLFPECKEKFSEAESRTTHVSIYHPEYSLEQICKQCDVKFWTADELKFHFSTVHKLSRPKKPGTRPRGDFDCADCSQKFNTAIKLKVHRIREHRKDSFKCEYCGNEYKFRQTLLNHMSFAHGHAHDRKEKKPNICQICGKEFPWKINLGQHLAGVHKMDSLACETCGENVPRHLLDKHLFKEHGIGYVKHWVCEVEGCGKVFYKKYDLKFHKRNTHEKDKVAPEFQCEECGKGFHVKTHLNRHVKLHRGKQELPWQCDECEKRFAREDYLKNHKISQHGEGQLVKRKRKRKAITKEDLS